MPDGTALSIPLPLMAPGGRRAVDIEQLLVWAVRDQRETAAGANIPSTLGYPKISGCGRIGAFIDVGRSGPALGDPDAEVVVQAVARLQGKARRLVIFHAAKGDRPDWLEGWQRWRPQPRVWSGDSGVIRPVTRNGEAVYVPFTWIDQRPAMEAARAAYALWRTALSALQLTLSAPPCPLSRWWPTGPDAAVDPWTRHNPY